MHPHPGVEWGACAAGCSWAAASGFRAAIVPMGDLLMAHCWSACPVVLQARSRRQLVWRRLRWAHLLPR